MVRVNGQIFFINELLQQSSGAYFIPERFFYREISQDGPLADPLFTKELHALGFEVIESDVSIFLVVELCQSTFHNSLDLSLMKRKLLQESQLSRVLMKI